MKKESLFILRNEDGDILAISEDKTLVTQYINQFYDYLITHNVTIDQETRPHVIRRLLNISIDSSMLQIYSDDIILTEMEYKFYDEHFKTIYEELKSMISNIISFKKYIKLSPDEELKIDEMFKFMYNKCQTFEDFLTNVDKDVIFNNVFIDPFMAKSNIEEFEALILNKNYNFMRERE